jgi:hypothetical protein
MENQCCSCGSTPDTSDVMLTQINPEEPYWYCENCIADLYLEDY